MASRRGIAERGLVIRARVLKVESAWVAQLPDGRRERFTRWFMAHRYAMYAVYAVTQEREYAAALDRARAQAGRVPR